MHPPNSRANPLGAAAGIPGVYGPTCRNREGAPRACAGCGLSFHKEGPSGWHFCRPARVTALDRHQDQERAEQRRGEEAALMPADAGINVNLSSHGGLTLCRPPARLSSSEGRRPWGGPKVKGDQVCLRQSPLSSLHSRGSRPEPR